MPKKPATKRPTKKTVRKKAVGRATVKPHGRPAVKRVSARGRAQNLEPQLQKYADVILDVGINLQPGQRLMIVNNLQYGVDVSLAPFVRMVAEAAYRRGCPFVDVIWGDRQLDRIRLQNASAESLKSYPDWPAAARKEHIEPADAYLALRGDDPDLLGDIDPQRVGQWLSTIREPVRPLLTMLSSNHTNWCVATVSAQGWADKVLPNAPRSERVTRLWQLILKTCRLKGKDPVANWREHIKNLRRRRDHLNGRQYAALMYSAPGTQLRVDLPLGHIWLGGQLRAANGVDFVPNLPTEEVFTLPHRYGVEGEVTATKPLVYNGVTIEGMHLVFEGGQVVKHSARKGEGILGELLRSDEGSRRLGEVALVPHSSPISRLGVVFHNTLFDENASCHLALGQAYRFTMMDAEGTSDEEFAERGGNSSKEHSDFMIGSSKMDIDGVRQDGSTEPVLRGGEWAFEA